MFKHPGSDPVALWLPLGPDSESTWCVHRTPNVRSTRNERTCGDNEVVWRTNRSAGTLSRNDFWFNGFLACACVVIKPMKLKTWWERDSYT